jgi:cytochrome b involved in lipid metabolism
MKKTAFSLAICALALSACTKQLPTQIQQTVPSETTSAAQSPESETASTTMIVQTQYSMEDVQKHATEKDCWLVIDSSVYDVTSFISQHPGGKAITRGCGTDATSMFESKSPHVEPQAQAQLQKLKIGELQK